MHLYVGESQSQEQNTVENIGFLKKRRSFLLGAIGVLYGFKCYASGELGLISLPKTISQAINLAGRQRMLSQRGAKLYAQILLNIRVDVAKKNINGTILEFEQQLSYLKSFLKGEKGQEKYLDLMGRQWGKYKAILAGQPSVAKLPEISEYSDAILGAANSLADLLQRSVGSKIGGIVNLSGRQRMLSQQLAKYLFFSANGYSEKNYTQDIIRARSEFSSAMNILKAAPENTPETLSWLTLGDSQWSFYDQFFSNIKKGTRLNDLAVASENILEVLEKLTFLYAKL
ncbi:type IV pili methyl-accepting chemotaxis transducer N-terminal domain-containing protein [Azospira inquinata]|uniref:Type IV pili methyl-accepting chemotaxis transducer N-terminal domain-containing protein n=1 Tax=Azospira inquinata TaxID=2785627 RepID=A0A975SP93_9RHOO|nr:type IV pili methyl-accepting chemotaxis transducer N-terminal domain-containing protein [Azospira inquinata]QWT45207.1 type IV pili methyl-accepting chemotaxis transducer N-terminal domain-containing protein [Azospira inquinata]QWT49460.1 type IV pili methyl-accepting chemotaxis transducer N-terminal domain-containing protein [Azospira inquinata]